MDPARWSVVLVAGSCAASLCSVAWAEEAPVGSAPVAVSSQESGASRALKLAAGAGLGALGGFAFGKLVPVVINRLRLEYEGLYPVFTLGTVMLTYSATALAGGGPLFSRASS